MTYPMDLMRQWLDEEKLKGAQNAQHAVLSTQGLNGHPHGRIVAIREIEEERILFFTQKRTRKVEELKKNSTAAITFWFERSAREVMIEGDAIFLSEAENEKYWHTYPRWAQIRFLSYAPTSGLPIENKQKLEIKRNEIESDHQDTPLPLSPDYCGIYVIPKRIVFYTYRLDELSDVWEYQINETGVVKKRLSP
tara:strand:+ start:1415 stop:1996 length:582 start_codon:yes stop_codon:yes gene_type:complete